MGDGQGPPPLALGLVAFVVLVVAIAGYGASMQLSLSDVEVHSGEELVQSLDAESQKVHLRMTPKSVGEIERITVVRPSGDVHRTVSIATGDTSAEARISPKFPFKNISQSGWTVYGFGDGDTPKFRITFTVNYQRPF